MKERGEGVGTAIWRMLFVVGSKRNRPLRPPVLHQQGNNENEKKAQRKARLGHRKREANDSWEASAENEVGHGERVGAYFFTEHGRDKSLRST